MDPITYVLDIAVNYFCLEVDMAFWSQYASFLFVGIIIIASVRGLLIYLMKVSVLRGEACEIAFL